MGEVPLPTRNASRVLGRVCPTRRGLPKRTPHLPDLQGTTNHQVPLQKPFRSPRRLQSRSAPGTQGVRRITGVRRHPRVAFPRGIALEPTGPTLTQTANGATPTITEWWCSCWAPQEGSCRHCAPL